MSVFIKMAENQPQILNEYEYYFKQLDLNQVKMRQGRGHGSAIHECYSYIGLRIIHAQSLLLSMMSLYFLLFLFEF